MAEFSIVTATFTLGGTAYCASEFSINHTTEALTFQCMSTVNPVTFPGLQAFNGSAVLAYETTGMDQLWGATGVLSIVVTKSTTGTITFASTTGIQVTDVSANFNNSELPQVNISWVANGVITEVVA